MKSISKRKGTVRVVRHRPTLYRIMVEGVRINTIRAVREQVRQTYDVPVNLVHDADHAKREALRLAAREHPAWLNLTTTVLS